MNENNIDCNISDIFVQRMIIYYKARDSLLFYGGVTIVKDNKDHEIKTIEELNEIILNQKQ